MIMDLVVLELFMLLLLYLYSFNNHIFGADFF